MNSNAPPQAADPDFIENSSILISGVCRQNVCELVPSCIQHLVFEYYFIVRWNRNKHGNRVQFIGDFGVQKVHDYKTSIVCADKRIDSASFDRFELSVKVKCPQLDMQGTQRHQEYTMDTSSMYNEYLSVMLGFADGDIGESIGDWNMVFCMNGNKRCSQFCVSLTCDEEMTLQARGGRYGEQTQLATMHVLRAGDVIAWRFDFRQHSAELFINAKSFGVLFEHIPSSIVPCCALFTCQCELMPCKYTLRS